MELTVIFILIAAAVVVLLLLLSKRSGTSSQRPAAEHHEPFMIPGSAEWRGELGERNVRRILSYLPGEDYIVLNDVLLPAGASTNQLDHIVVSVYGIFVIETKNYSGKLYGGKSSDKWTQYLGGQQYELYNPILQNRGHVHAVSTFLRIDSRYLIPLVVFTGSAEIKAPLGNCAVYSESLYQRILQYRTPLLSHDQMYSYARRLDKAMEENSSTKRMHINNVRESIYRKNEEIKNGNCPICDGYLTLRHGKYGQFWGCSNYPNCRYTRNIQ